MQKSTLILTSQSFIEQFERCCKEYTSLHMSVAWCGDPKQTLPYKHLERLKKSLSATVGIKFNHTHPNAIEWFKDIGADIRIFNNDCALFHPKVYMFTIGDRYALFVGSSNLTYGGFYLNVEVNTLIEGILVNGKGEDIRILKQTLNLWHSDKFSFDPTTKWINKYRKSYETTAAKERENKIPTPHIDEEEISSASWLSNADWDTYYAKIVEGLEKQREPTQKYHDVLDVAKSALPLPWNVGYFDDLEKRRIIGGISEYGWLGHVAASGHFRHLLAKGIKKQHEIIVNAVNKIAAMNPPISWSNLETALNDLMKIGFTMKVWGRLLCIVRPDIYCTVSSPSVRKNLSRTLDVAQAGFATSDGYIRLLKFVHAAPWFNSTRPKNKTEAAIWNRRAAFMDVIFYFG